MPREKEQYRENLMALSEAFPGKELICLKDAARYIGMDPRTLLKIRDFPVEKAGRRYIVRTRRLASWLS